MPWYPHSFTGFESARHLAQMRVGSEFSRCSMLQWILHRMNTGQRVGFVRRVGSPGARASVATVPYVPVPVQRRDVVASTRRSD